MAARKLTRAAMNALKLKWIREPGAVCPLCLRPLNSMDTKDVVIDHDHKTGLIRGALCRGCNGAEGKVANSAGRWAGLGMDYDKIVPWLERLCEYLRSKPTDMIYPTHLSEEEKKKKAGDKRRIAAQAKAKARMDKIREQRKGK